MFLFLTVIQALVAAALVGVVLMQRSEGGGLGIGGSPTGMLSARGAADFLTKATRWLAIVFVGLSIALAALAVKEEGGASLDTTLNRTVQPASPADPLGPSAGNSNAPASPAPASPAPAAPAKDPLAPAPN
ncbi:preprotein translocase subunit SecG [Porphyrobacter algicida]|uniref:Protein-export membrane protein SecG n=1 Tax=Qipengyuania algicida TaxID=1836209 RepID=A0A845ADI5_9SPHN|nr:preprotein translocase subunit SecG [Qipengyuania algicida]MXP28532.1 preprotein translocase subunit SecG [Qipengyuania algicida]